MSDERERRAGKRAKRARIGASRKETPQKGERADLTRRELLAAGAVASGALILPAGLAGCGKPVKAPADARAVAGVAKAFEAFGVSEARVRKVMARALQNGGDFCDLYFHRRRINWIGLEDHAVNRASTRADIGLGVRVVRGVETGYAYTESLDEASMLAAAGVAASVAQGGGSIARAPHAFRAGKHPITSYYPVKTPWPGVSTKDKAALLSKLEKLVLARDKRIRKVNVSYRDEDHQLLIIDSSGRVFADSQPMTVTYVSCSAEHEGKRESNYAAMAGRSGFEFYTDARLQKAAREVVERTTVLFDAVGGPVGELPLVLGPGSSGILLHEAIGHGMEADFARKRTTIYSDKVGKRIAPKDVTIVDDGVRPGLRGSINLDDEGNPSKRTVLVENGVLRTFLHDRISAKHFGVEPTGSGRRQSFRHMPLPRMRNTYMLAGPRARDEIIKTVKRGIYAEHFTNGQVNIGPGDFSFYVKNGMLIEDGKLTQPIKDVNIIGNGPKVLEGVAMVGNDFKLDEGGWTCGKRGQRVPVGLGMPTVKINAITVGGAGGKKKKG